MAIKAASKTSTTGKKTGVVTVDMLRAASADAMRTGLPVYLNDPAPKGSGRLVLRLTPGGACLASFRYTDADGARPSPIRVGDVDLMGTTDGARATLAVARAKAGELSRLYLSGIKDLAGYLAGVERKRTADEVVDRERAAASERARISGSLQALLNAYVESLEGRASQYDVRNIFENHVSLPWPALVLKKAADVTSGELRDVLARLVVAGKGRTADKARAYLRAAYSAAIKAEFSPTLVGAFGAFSIAINPVDKLAAMPQFNKVLDRTLTMPELRCFWRRLQAMPETAQRDAVVTALLLGGQRPTQLLRLTAGDVDMDAGTLALYDGKGRNRAANPRRHVLPIPDELAPLIARRLTLNKTKKPENPVFSTDLGETFLREETASKVVLEVRAEMMAANEVERGPFTWRDLRRTCETRLAELGVSKDVRAQLLSHGVSGVQDRHYDKHGYLNEKRGALALFIRHLNGNEKALRQVA